VRCPSDITPIVIQATAISRVGSDKAQAATNRASGKQISSAKRVFIPCSPEAARRAGVQFLGVVSGTTHADAWRLIGQPTVSEGIDEILDLVASANAVQTKTARFFAEVEESR
jgi:hypothetical protein